MIEGREFTRPRDGVSFRVGAFEVEPRRNELHLGEATFSIEPLVMDVLCYLAEQAGSVLAREQIINHVWIFNPDADESLTRAVSLLRGIFRHDGDRPDYIKTIYKRGYTLVAEVRSSDARSVTTVPDTQLAAIANVHDAYSVAVLGFHNHSMQADDNFLADGVTRDLTMLLSRVPRLRVAAYSSAVRVDEHNTSLPEISRRLGVRHVVCGSLTRQGNQFQLRAALMDACNDTQIWAQRLDAPLADFYAIQDRLVLDISTSIASALQVSSCAAIQGRSAFQLNTYELVQRAESLRQHYNRDTAQQIVALLERALALDPTDATVHAGLAVQHTQNVVSRFCGSPGETFSLARRHVDTALNLAPQDPAVLGAAGIAATMMGNARLAVRNLRQSVALDPNNAHILAVLGWQQCWLQGDASGIELIQTAERRAPHHPRYALWANYRGHCHIRLGNVDAAIDAFRECEDRNPQYSLNLVNLAAAFAFVGQLDHARDALDRVHQIAADYALEDYEQMARRMVYGFGKNPSGEQMIAALRGVWTPAAA